MSDNDKVFDFKIWSNGNCYPSKPNKAEYLFFNFVCRVVDKEGNNRSTGGSFSSSSDMEYSICSFLYSLHDNCDVEGIYATIDYALREDLYDSDEDSYWEAEKFAHLNKEELRVRKGKDIVPSDCQSIDIFMYRHQDFESLNKAQEDFKSLVKEYKDNLAQELSSFYNVEKTKASKLLDKLQLRRPIIDENFIKEFHNFVELIGD